MKKLITIFGVFLLASFIFTSCGSTDAKENGKEAGELQCEYDALEKEWDELDKEQNKLDWDKGSEEDREKMADLNDDKRDILEEMTEIGVEISELNNNRWKATEGKDDRADWDKDYKEAKEAEEKKCEQK